MCLQCVCPPASVIWLCLFGKSGLDDSSKISGLSLFNLLIPAACVRSLLNHTCWFHFILSAQRWPHPSCSPSYTPSLSSKFIFPASLKTTRSLPVCALATPVSLVLLAFMAVLASLGEMGGMDETLLWERRATRGTGETQVMSVLIGEWPALLSTLMPVFHFRWDGTERLDGGQRRTRRERWAGSGRGVCSRTKISIQRQDLRGPHATPQRGQRGPVRQGLTERAGWLQPGDGPLHLQSPRSILLHRPRHRLPNQPAVRPDEKRAHGGLLFPVLRQLAQAGVSVGQLAAPPRPGGPSVGSDVSVWVQRILLQHQDRQHLHWVHRLLWLEKLCCIRMIAQTLNWETWFYTEML